MRRGVDQLPQPVAPGIELATRLEYVSHRCAEYAAPLTRRLSIAVPLQRLAPMRVAEKAPRTLRTPKVKAEARGPCVRVAVLAGRRHANAAPPWVERVVRPLDL